MYAINRIVFLKYTYTYIFTQILSISSFLRSWTTLMPSLQDLQLLKETFCYRKFRFHRLGCFSFLLWYFKADKKALIFLWRAVHSLQINYSFHFPRNYSKFAWPYSWTIDMCQKPTDRIKIANSYSVMVTVLTKSKRVDSVHYTRHRPESNALTDCALYLTRFFNKMLVKFTVFRV